jgi:hypothetical protein
VQSSVVAAILVVAARFWTLLRLVLQLKHDGDAVRWRLVACLSAKSADGSRDAAKFAAKVAGTRRRRSVPRDV